MVVFGYTLVKTNENMGQAKRRKQLDPNYGKTLPAFQEIMTFFEDLIFGLEERQKTALHITKNIKDNKFAFVIVDPYTTKVRFVNSLDNEPPDVIDPELAMLNNLDHKVIYVIHSNQTKRRVLTLNKSQFSLN